MDREPDMEVCGEAGSAAELLDRLREGGWDVLVLDLALPDRSGLDVLGEVTRDWPEMTVVVFTMHDDRRYVRRALREGASGYVTKDRAEEIVLAVREAAAGGRFVSPNLSGWEADGREAE